MAVEDSKHEYEPGFDGHKMHTDSVCAACGMPRNAWVHQ